MRRYFVAIGLVTILFIAFQNCGEIPAHTPINVTEESLQTLKSDLDTLVNNACTTDMECAQVAVGHKLCGGPSDYIVYSSANTNEELFLSKVDEYTRMEKIYQSKLEGVMGTCNIILPYKDLTCVNSVCTGSGELYE